MNAPPEIVSQILREAVKILPFSDIFRSRLVNSFFADEILKLILESPRLESEGFRFGLRSDNPLQAWTEFPMQLKRRYLYMKIQRHMESPCVLSSFVHDILASQTNEINNNEQRCILIEKLVFAILHGRYFPQIICSAEDYELYMRSFYRTHSGLRAKLVETALQLTHAVDAIKRNDCAELQALLEQGLRIDHSIASLDIVDRSNIPFDIVPLGVAAMIGSKEIIKLLVANDCPLEYGEYGVYHEPTHVLTVAANNGNKAALEEWMEHLKKTRQDSPTLLSKTFNSIAEIGNLETLEFLEDRYRSDFAEFRFKGVVSACASQQWATVRWFLDRGGIELNKPFWNGLRGFLSFVLPVCKPPLRAQMVEILLQNGASPNEVLRYPPRTALQWAVDEKDFDTAKLLLNHGADVNGVGSKRGIPPLLLAGRRRCSPLIRLLLDKGANRTCRGKSKTHVFSKDSGVIGHIEELLGELGWDEEEVKDEDIDYFVLDYPKALGP